jgi:hypothetical protein
MLSNPLSKGVCSRNFHPEITHVCIMRWGGGRGWDGAGSQKFPLLAFFSPNTMKIRFSFHNFGKKVSFLA